MEPVSVPRRHDLDWLRVLAILAIFVFHTTRMFDVDNWNVKNATSYLFVNVWKDFATSWGMPLILIISGASAFYALGKVRPGRYLLGLTARLLLPLILGIFTGCAFQMYVENLQKGKFAGSLLEFYPHYFDGMYGFGGNFAWMGLHLWYLEILFILSLLCLPLFAWLRYGSLGRRVLGRLGALLALPGAPFLFTVPVVLLINALDPATWGNREMGGWSVFIYPCFFVAGFVTASGEKLQGRIRQMRWASLALGAALSALYLLWEYDSTLPRVRVLGGSLTDLALVLSSWSWLLAVFGFGTKHLVREAPFLRYANEGALPFYILHQTAIVGVGYFAAGWNIPDLLKWAALLAISFAVTLGLYELGVRRWNAMRILFGMKPLPKLSSSSPSPVEGATAGQLHLPSP